MRKPQNIKLLMLHKSSVACDTADFYHGSLWKLPTETEAGINCLQIPIGNATKELVILWGTLSVQLSSKVVSRV